MTDDSTPDLRGLCDASAAELDDVSEATAGTATTYAREGVDFASVDGRTLRVRLPVDIAEAAANTPDARLDPTDRGWLEFSPAQAEPHALDRATAWFHIAWKHATDN